MRRLMFACLAMILFCAVPARAQHTAVLTWTLSTDDTTANCTTAANCTQNVYRAPGACTQTNPVFTQLTSVAPTITTANDATITPGVWCYAVTFSMNGIESARSVAQVSLPPASPSGVVVRAT